MNLITQLNDDDLVIIYNKHACKRNRFYISRSKIKYFFTSGLSLINIVSYHKIYKIKYDYKKIESLIFYL
jgi:hypothetical protein